MPVLTTCPLTSPHAQPHTLTHILCSLPWIPSRGPDSPAVTPPFPGLAIDFPESKLYWISSGNHTINRCNLDGSGLEVIDAMRSQLGKATALAIMGEGCWAKQR